MKIRIRIKFLIPFLSIIVFILLTIIYFNCYANYRPAFDLPIFFEEATSAADEVIALKEELWDMPIDLTQRRKRRIKVSPIVEVDSNRAIEVIDDDESDLFLSDLSFDAKDVGDITTRNSIFHVKSVKECLNTEKTHALNDNRQHFPDLVQLSQEMTKSPLFRSSTRPRMTLQQLLSTESGGKQTTMEKFQSKISDQDLYEENDVGIEVLLDEMATMKMKHVVEYSKGTQLKLFITFEDGSQAILKPMRFDREKETNPNHFYFTDFERHNSEIAAFHLDRILGFRHCPPVVGRKVNIKTDLYDNADKELKKTFFISPANNICFTGHCKQYCDTSHAICGQPAVLEVSLAPFLLPTRKKWKNPWKRSYSKRHPTTEWQKNELYCRVVRQQPLYNNSKRLADLMDTFIVDFLIGNMDRHTYETFENFGNDSFILHLDQGRGFGQPNHDELSILTPLIQCCFLNSKTFYTLVDLQHGDMKLSSLTKCSLDRDRLHPVLSDAHLEALDRRLEIILHVIRNCIHNHGMNNVFHK